MKKKTDPTRNKSWQTKIWDSVRNSAAHLTERGEHSCARASMNAHQRHDAIARWFRHPVKLKDIVFDRNVMIFEVCCADGLFLVHARDGGYVCGFRLCVSTFLATNKLHLGCVLGITI